MSLINDALKRTRDAVGASKQNDVDSYRITSQPEAKSKRSRPVVWIAVTVGVIVVALAGYVAFRLLNNAPAPSEVTEVKHPVLPPPAPAVPTETPSAPVTAAKTAGVTSNADQTAENTKDSDSDTPTTADTDSEPPTPPPVVVVEPPKLVLEGITSDELGQEALINGIVLKVGEEFMGATVTAIERRVVRLKFNQKEIVLRMP